jgi:hypothetical protein
MEAACHPAQLAKSPAPAVLPGLLYALLAVMRTMNSIRLATIASAFILAGCASARGRTEGPTVPIDVQVNNNLHFPGDITVYVVSSGGNRTLLGGAPPGTTRNFTFKPVSFSEPYYFLATRARGRDIRSATFTVRSDLTGRIDWSLAPNVVGFEEMDEGPATPP